VSQNRAALQAGLPLQAAKIRRLRRCDERQDHAASGDHAMRLVCPACPGRSDGCAMINPKLLDKILAISFGILTLIVALLAYLNAEKIWEELTHSIFEPSITLPRTVIIVFIFIPVFGISCLWNYFLFKILAELNNTRQFLAAAEGQRKQLDLLRFVDVITRIPNQLQWGIILSISKMN
jgi:hypothetical protein